LSGADRASWSLHVVVLSNAVVHSGRSLAQRGNKLRKLRTRMAAIGAATFVSLGLLAAPSAYASEAYSGDDLTPEQQQAVASWESGVDNTTVDRSLSRVKTEVGIAAASAGGTKTLSLYRGSWVMWARENVQFGYSGNGSTVNWSSGWQESGWVFPNNVTEKGQTRYYKSSTRHEWRGGYAVGAGVPTPWGNANVYSATSTARSTIKNIGSIQWWLN